MDAVVMNQFGPPDVLVFQDVPTPTPGLGDALVRVGVVEVSRTRDVGTRSGAHPFSRAVSLPHVLGGDCAGVVESVGPHADARLVGRRVAVMNTHSCGACPACRAGREYECADLEMIGIHRWGSYAQFVTVPVGSLHALPDDITLGEAAALAAVGPIALQQLRTAAVHDSSTLLVTGATGALATVLMELAAWFGAQVVALTRRRHLIGSGSGRSVLDTGADDLTGRVRDHMCGPGSYAVVDNVCNPGVLDRYFPVLPNGTRIVIPGAIGVPELPVLRVPAGPLYVRSIALIGVRTATAQVTRDFCELVRSGFRVPADLLHEQPLHTAAAAHQAVLDGSAAGHTLLVVDPTLRGDRRRARTTGMSQPRR